MVIHILSVCKKLLVHYSSNATVACQTTVLLYIQTALPPLFRKLQDLDAPKTAVYVLFL